MVKISEWSTPGGQKVQTTPYSNDSVFRGLEHMVGLPELRNGTMHGPKASVFTEKELTED